jgi:hypothetical protein
VFVDISSIDIFKVRDPTNGRREQGFSHSRIAKIRRNVTATWMDRGAGSAGQWVNLSMGKKGQDSICYSALSRSRDGGKDEAIIFIFP